MAVVEVRGLRKDFGDVTAVDGVDLQLRGGRVPRPPRALRVRQDHPAPDDRRSGAAHRGRDPARRRGRQRPSSPGPAHRHGVPVLCPLSPHDGGQQHRLPPQGAGHGPRGAHQERWSGPPVCSGSSGCSNDGPVSSPVGSASGWPWRGPSCASPRCSSSTSRSPTSTPSCGRRHATTHGVPAPDRDHHHLRHP